MSQPQCREPSCANFGDADFGEATCPAEHADAPIMNPVVAQLVGELRARRKLLKIRKVEVAAACRVLEQIITYVERGDIEPTTSLLLDYAARVQMNLTWQLTAPGTHVNAAGDWMQVMIAAPPETGAAVLGALREQHGFTDTDWCVMERPGVDFARVDYAPIDPLTTSYHG